MERKDYLIIAGAAIAVGILWLTWQCFWGNKGNEVVILCDNKTVYSCSLYKEKYIALRQGIPIEMDTEDKAIEMFNSDEDITNIVVIKYGQAEVLMARCPDKICVNTHSVNATGQSVVCMPNRVAVSIR